MNKIKSKFNNLKNSRINLVSFLEIQDKSALTFKADKNTWSPLQVCFHIIKSEQLTLLALNKNLQSKDNLKKSGFVGVIRDIFLGLVLKSKIKFKAPPLVSNIPEDYDFTELMKKWETIRSSFKEYIDNFPNEYLDKKILKHPVAGGLNLVQTLNFLQNHFDHHRIQILKRIEEHTIINNKK